MKILHLAFCILNCWVVAAQDNYQSYHQRVITAEELLVEKPYRSALDEYRQLTAEYPFVFLRDLKVAAQLAVFNKDTSSALRWLQQGINQGWAKKEIKKVPLLRPFISLVQFPSMDTKPSKANVFIDSLIRLDQRMALRAFARVREKSRQRFINKKFIPHSTAQLNALIDWLESNPWPGEQTAGKGYMASTIVSHHNSMSPEYNTKDTLFQRLYLQQALESGHLSPFHYALMHDWKSVVSDENRTAFGFVGSITNQAHLQQVNVNRQKIGLRSISLRNQLVKLQDHSEFIFFLPGNPWQDGAILIQGE